MRAARLLDDWEIHAVNAQASSFLEEGIRLMQSDSVEAALISFDRALELRRHLPTQVPAHAYALAACWLNRAEALARLDRLHHSLALHSYDQALLLLRSLPLTGDSRFPRRLAVAHQNRALVLAAQQPPAITDATAALTDAIAVLNQAEIIDPAERDYLRAVAWMNLATVQMLTGHLVSDLAAEDAALRALAFVKPYEGSYSTAAEIGIKTRHILRQSRRAGQTDGQLY